MKFLTAFIIALFALPLQNAHAKNVILTGVQETQYICHDGANRGATIRLLLSTAPAQKSKSSGLLILPTMFADMGAKTYYTRPNCVNLNDHAETIANADNDYYDDATVYASYIVDGISFRKDVTGRCGGFRFKHKNNGRKLWVQTGGTIVTNVNCVLKDGI